jgi:hypothetical protein
VILLVTLALACAFIVYDVALFAIRTFGPFILWLAAFFVLVNASYFQSEVVRVRHVPTGGEGHPILRPSLQISAAMVRSHNNRSKGGGFRTFVEVIDQGESHLLLDSVLSGLSNLPLSNKSD